MLQPVTVNLFRRATHDRHSQAYTFPQTRPDVDSAPVGSLLKQQADNGSLLMHMIPSTHGVSLDHAIAEMQAYDQQETPDSVSTVPDILRALADAIDVGQVEVVNR